MQLTIKESYTPAGDTIVTFLGQYPGEDDVSFSLDAQELQQIFERAHKPDEFLKAMAALYRARYRAEEGW